MAPKRHAHVKLVTVQMKTEFAKSARMAVFICMILAKNTKKHVNRVKKTMLQTQIRQCVFLHSNAQIAMGI